jgi:hypothetical protein
MPITATPYTAVYGPLSLTGVTCLLWLDGADTTTITGTSPVTQWRDKSGGGFNAASASTGPTYNTSGNYMTFNGSSQYLTTSLTVSANSHCLIAVWNPTTVSATSQGNTSVFRFQAGPYIIFPYMSGASPKGYVTSFDSTTINYANSPLLENSVAGQTTIGIANIASNTQAVYRNGGTPTTATATISSGTSDSLTIGVGNNEYFQGNIYEMIIYSTALSISQRQTIEGYLAQKWGLTSSLPAGHPGLTQTLYNGRVYQSRIPLSPQPIYQNFKPTQLTGVTCALWMDGADSSTFSLSGTTVTQWRDKSGLGYNSTTIGGTPALTANALNGLSAISFNGSSYILGPNANTTATGTFFVIASLASGQGAGQQFTNVYAFSRPLNGTSCGNEAQSICGLACANAATSLALFTQRNTFNGPTFTAPNYNTAFMHTIVINGTTIAGYGNGSSLGTISSSGNFGYTFYNIGSQTYQLSGILSQNYYWTGYVGELIAFNNALSDSQRQQIEGYLAWKWGLQSSLPSNHPYLNVPPGVPWESSLTRGLTRLTAITATGGTIVTANGFRTHTFTTVGTTNFVVTQALQTGTTVQVLIVAGGGSGSGDRAAGGGAGGLIFTTTSVTQGTYAAVVGAGGTVGTGNVHGTDGSNSSFNGQVAIGGGSGGSHYQGAYIGNTGGSGGGGAAPGPGTPTAAGGTGTSGQGYGGGTGYYNGSICSAGGGGGAGGAGSNATTSGGGNGGPGLSITIGGVTGYYAAGGGGAAAQDYGATIGGRSGSTATWTPIINVLSNCTLTGTGPYTYYKSAGLSDGTYDTAVYSTYGFTSNILLSFSVYSTGGTNNKMIGFSTNQLAGGNYTNVQYGFYLDAGINIYSDEGGTLTNIGNTYTTSTVFMLTYDGTNMKYYKDGTVLRTVAVSSGSTYYLNSGMVWIGNGFQNVYFGGGGNADQTSTTPATAGIANTGSGGAGAGNSTWNTNATNGGSGIVIISYPYP